MITGGHLSPALSLLPLLRQRHSVLFIGRKYVFEGDRAVSFEYTTIKSLRIPFRTITTGRLQRRFTAYTLSSLLKFPIGLFQSLFILMWERPAAVLSFGGYVALPVCVAALLLGIPIVTHEQTAVNAGLANRIIGMFAKKICISFEASKKYFPPSKTVLTGNPIRKALLTSLVKSPFPSLSKGQNVPIMYITGGSGGSHSINMLISSMLAHLLTNYIVIHQTGDSAKHRDFAMLSDTANMLPPKLRSRYIVQKHVTGEELAWIYTHASLLIGRSGASTVYEILRFGLPALFIPLPWAGFSEQLANASLVESVGLGKVLNQEELTTSSFLAAVSEMIVHNKKYREHAQDALQLVIPDADEKIAAVVENIS